MAQAATTYTTSINVNLTFKVELCYLSPYPALKVYFFYKHVSTRLRHFQVVVTVKLNCLSLAAVTSVTAASR
jgi:hypothetical protein